MRCCLEGISRSGKFGARIRADERRRVALMLLPALDR